MVRLVARCYSKINVLPQLVLCVLNPIQWDSDYCSLYTVHYTRLVHNGNCISTLQSFHSGYSMSRLQTPRMQLSSEKYSIDQIAEDY